MVAMQKAITWQTKRINQLKRRSISVLKKLYREIKRIHFDATKTMSLKEVLVFGLRISLPPYLIMRSLGNHTLTLKDSEKTYFVYHLQSGILWDTLSVTEFRREDREKYITTNTWSIVPMKIDHKIWNNNLQ